MYRQVNGHLLRRYRLRRGHSLETLAQAAGIGKSTISGIERGVTMRAHPSTIAALCVALDVDLDLLAPIVDTQEATP